MLLNWREIQLVLNEDMKCATMAAIKNTMQLVDSLSLTIGDNTGKYSEVQRVVPLYSSQVLI